MPEIKRTFTAGKMNKDLDERLVPNGEYRDATNIQVSTSDGSNAFNSSQYEQQQFTDTRDPSFGAGTKTITKRS